jgi:hypothetical protein
MVYLRKYCLPRSLKDGWPANTCNPMLICDVPVQKDINLQK